MDNLSHFHSLEELIRALDRERKLLHALFQDRKKLSFRYDFARDLASKKDESIEFLRRYGVIRENTVFVELEDVYLKQGGRIKMRSPPKVLTGNFRPSQLSFFLS